MKEINLEKLQNQFSYKEYLFNSPMEARRQFASIDYKTTSQMAEVYQRAFGGAPWFEKFKCGDCGEFSATEKCCPACQGSSMGEAYPKNDLINNYFPTTLSEFTPGVLVNALKNGKVIGFSTGGVSRLNDLIGIKYKGNAQILQSVLDKTGLSPESNVFYENETCIDPDEQQQGVGTLISRVRFDAAKNTGTDVIVGRTINIPWLALKEKQFTSAGFDFDYFVPEGDKYQVEGNPRNFYVAKKRSI